VTNDPVIHSEAEQAADEERKLHRKLAREVEDADIRWLMSSKRGRRIVWRLLEQSELFAQEFRPDGLWLAFAAGRRHFGGSILEQIHSLCPELWPVMVKERKHDRNDDTAGE
jgi:hypothetical protein